MDRYEKDGNSAILCLKFSPDGQLLATGMIDGKIKVYSLKMSFSNNPTLLYLDLGHLSKTDESHV